MAIVNDYEGYRITKQIYQNIFVSGGFLLALSLPYQKREREQKRLSKFKRDWIDLAQSLGFPPPQLKT